MATSVHLEYAGSAGLKVGLKGATIGQSIEFDRIYEHEVIHETPTSHKVAFGILAAGLVIALAGDGYLWSKSDGLMKEISSTQSGTQAQISKFNDATNYLYASRSRNAWKR